MLKAAVLCSLLSEVTAGPHLNSARGLMVIRTYIQCGEGGRSIQASTA